jgi:hypothetical protein
MKLTYLHLTPEQALPELPSGPFLVIIVAEANVTGEWQDRTADWLVECGCLYAVAWGVDCEKWHDSVDWAALRKFDFGDIPDDQFIMTTWHNDEPLTEAFWFAGNCGHHPDVELTRSIILHISSEARGEELLRIYHQSQVLPDGDEVGGANIED